MGGPGVLRGERESGAPELSLVLDQFDKFGEHAGKSVERGGICGHRRD